MDILRGRLKRLFSAPGAGFTCRGCHYYMSMTGRGYGFCVLDQDALDRLGHWPVVLGCRPRCRYYCAREVVERFQAAMRALASSS